MDFLVHHMLRSSAERSPDKEAMVSGTIRLSYRDAWRKVGGLGVGLRKLGMERGDRIGVYMEPSVAQALSILGINRAGGVFVPVNEVLFPEQVAHIANDCRMRGIVTSRARIERTLEALKATPTVKFVVVATEDALPEVNVETQRFEDLVSESVPSDWKEWSISKDLAALIYTSGSTGRAKGVMLNHAQLMAGSAIVSNYLGITAEHRTLAALPFSFDAGLNQLMTAMQHGATVVIQPFVFARELVKALVEEEITGMGAVPPLWSLMAQPSSGLHKHQYPHLRYISNTGGAMPLTVLEALRKHLPTTRVFLMYGLTEAFRSTYLPPEELVRRPTSMGKAIPNTEILVVDDDGKPVQPGEIGELVHRGPTVSMGYWGQPELTNKVLRPHPYLEAELGQEEKVVYSGDLVKTDEEGFLYFVARRDAMIKSSGFRISPTEVESVLFQSGRLREAGVIGVPDELLGQTIKAFVVPRDGDSVDAEELIAFCAERMPRHMVPRSVEALPSLPKTGSGKIDYPALRRLQGLQR
jgi:acyl-CoA ligase (AMP-forming) (exosortase A-associated)